MSERIVVRTKEPLRILCVGDAHFPYANKNFVTEIIGFSKDFAPTHIVQIGDIYDQYNFSKYPKEHIEGPDAEIFRGQKEAKDFWQRLNSTSPKAQRFQVVGNHCIRMLKKIKQTAPELHTAVKRYWNEIYTFEGVRTLADDRSELVINNILFIHGYLSNLGDHARLNRQSVVVGHSHRGGVVYSRHNDATLFELNCGHIADDNKLPFAYTPQRTTFWTPGFGVIETTRTNLLSARFIPL